MQALKLPEWYIAAGYVRNYVWDRLHDRTEAASLNDVDVIYFDLTDTSEETEKRYEQRLKSQVKEYNWSVKNQARMHTRNKARQYDSIEDAMRKWPETVTAIGLSLEGPDDQIRILAPYGLEDLFQLKLRQSPEFEDREYFEERVNRKGWLQMWPKLQMVNS